MTCLLGVWHELLGIVFEEFFVSLPEGWLVLIRTVRELCPHVLSLKDDFVNLVDTSEGLLLRGLQLDLDVGPVPNARLDVTRSGH